MHAYVLCRATATLLLPDGVAAPLQMIVQDQLSAVVEPDLQLEELQQADERLLHAVLVHDRVIRDLFQQTTVLPLRFTAFPSLVDLRSDLQHNQHLYLETLSRLDGKAEVTIKFVPEAIAEQPLATDLKGKDYFLAKKRHHQAQQQQREQQRHEFEQILQAIAQHYPLSAQPDTHQAHILLDRDDFVKQQHYLLPYLDQLNHWQVSVSDALPPFHFV